MIPEKAMQKKEANNDEISTTCTMFLDFSELASSLSKDDCFELHDNLKDVLKYKVKGITLKYRDTLIRRDYNMRKLSDPEDTFDGMTLTIIMGLPS